MSTQDTSNLVTVFVFPQNTLGADSLTSHWL